MLMTKKEWFHRLLPHALAVSIFLLAAFAYCRPAFNHQVLVQEDITQWKAMAQSSFVYKAQHGHFPLWTESMFGGMPAYLIAMEAHTFSPHSIVYDILTLHLPAPANFFFLACICLYFLTQVLRVHPYIGIVTGLAYAYATYNPVIISVGHETKMQAIAMLPAFIAGLMLLYDKRYAWGATMTVLGTALVVSANHMQIFYYGLIIAAVMTIGYALRWIMQKDWRHLLIALPLAAGCWVIGILSNAVSIFTTNDLSKATIRGGSELADDPSAQKGLSTDYAFSYSLYPNESFVLMVPKIYGGSSGQELSEDKSKAVAALHQLPQATAAQIQQNDLLTWYWGGIGNTAGPAYAGAVICFFALIGMFILDNKHKWWIAATCILALLMSWGGYLPGFNGLLLKYLPLYNKFRAPSVILVVPVFLLTVLAALTLHRILTEPRIIVKKYGQGLLLTAAIFIVLLAFYFRLDYTTWYDRHFLQQTDDQAKPFFAALREDRRSLFLHSLLRSFLFIAAAAALAALYMRGKIRSWLLLATIGVLAYIDIMGIDLQYLNSSNYKPKTTSPGDQVASATDSLILKDTGYYRVFDLRYGPEYTLTYGAATAWFHRTIGGYNAAKLSIYQDLISHQLEKYPNCRPVIDMLNTRYLIQRGPNGDTVVRNEGALGPAWFVRGIVYAPGAKAVMEGLTTLNVKDSAILFAADSVQAGQIINAGTAGADSIRLTLNNNDEMVYESSTAARRFAVFSEVYYRNGWKAYIDGKEAPIFRTNYVLRGVSIPQGRHTIRFDFHPRSFYLGGIVQNIAGILTLIIILLALRWRRRTGLKIVVAPA
ncbi:MAG TPA: YfhO family protein [Puia sp.]|nr:YfhO family protein [Puia sp.]